MAHPSLAVADVFRRHAPQVFAYLRGLADNRQDAEDLLQDTFVAAIAGLPGFAGKSSVRTWLFAIARRRYLMLLRRRRRTPRAVPAADPGTDFAAAGGASWAADVAEEVAAGDAVARWLRAIPERQRTAFWLREYVGLSIEEIAGVLGVAPGTARVILFRAREKLRELVKEERSQ